MIYVFDTSSIRQLNHYPPDRFPSFWQRFDDLVFNHRVVSVREVYRELEHQDLREHVHDWKEGNRNLFMVPGARETMFVAEIFAVPHFQYLLKEKDRLTNKPEADPWVIAAAKAIDGCVVTQERKNGNAIRIPLVCEHFGIMCVTLQGLMEREGWRF
jgi:hypothetical protein